MKKHNNAASNSKRLKNPAVAYFSNQSSIRQPKVFIKTFGCPLVAL